MHSSGLCDFTFFQFSLFFISSSLDSFQMRTLAVVAVSALLMVLARAERAPTPPPTNPVNGPVIGILTQDLGEDVSVSM